MMKSNYGLLSNLLKYINKLYMKCGYLTQNGSRCTRQIYGHHSCWQHAGARKKSRSRSTSRKTKKFTAMEARIQMLKLFKKYQTSQFVSVIPLDKLIQLFKKVLKIEYGTAKFSLITKNGTTYNGPIYLEKKDMASDKRIYAKRPNESIKFVDKPNLKYPYPNLIEDLSQAIEIMKNVSFYHIKSIQPDGTVYVRSYYSL